MANLIELMQKAKKMKDEMEKVQKELEKTNATGESKKSLVKITLSGKNTIINIEIDDSIININDKKALITNLEQAFNDANDKIEKIKKEKMKGATGGFSIPGLF